MEKIEGPIVIHFDLVWLIASPFSATSDEDVGLVDVEYTFDEVRGRVHIHFYLSLSESIVSLSLRHLCANFSKNRLCMGFP